MQVQNKREYLEKSKDLFCLTLVLTGMFICMSDFIELKVSQAAMFLGIAGITLLFLLLEVKTTWRRYVLVVLAVLVLLELAGSRRELQQGFLGCVNQLLAILERYYDTGFGQIPWEENPKLRDYFFRIFLIGTGCVEGIIWYFTRKKKGLCFRMFLPAILITGIMLAGNTPSFAGILLLVTGAAAGKLKTENPSAFGGMVLILLSASIFAHSKGAETFIREMHDPWQERQWETEEAAWNYIKNYLPDKQVTERQEEIQLGNQKPYRNGRVVFKITLPEYPKDSIYLKGFAGGIYENGNWQAVPKEIFQKFAEDAGYEAADYARWLAEQPFEVTAGIMENTENSDPLDVKIEMSEEAKGYTLVPYYSSYPEGSVLWEDDGAAYPGQQKEYNWRSYLHRRGSRNGQNVLFNSQKNDRWEAYIQYVNIHYLQFPKGLDKIKELAEEKVYGVWHPEEWVSNLLSQQAKYSLDLDPLPEDKEFTEDFLFRQKKGYCVHFATAGTLLLRMSGIPARYVSGYRVLPEDFKKNPDGTFTAAVTDKRAHAWSEVFELEKGFYPVEMTPAATEEEIFKQNPKEAISKQQQEKEILKQEPEEIKNEIPKPLKEKSKNAEKERASESVIVNQVFGITAAVLLLAVMAAAIMIVMRREAIKRCRKRLWQENRRAAVLEIGKEVFRLLKICGYYREKNMADQTYARILQEKIPIAEAVNWQQFVSILQKAAFSEQTLTEEDWQEAWNLYQRVCQLLERSQNKRHRFFRKFIRMHF